VNATYNFCINDIATEVNNKELIGLILVWGTQNGSENPRSLGEKDIEWKIAAHKGPITEEEDTFRHRHHKEIRINSLCRLIGIDEESRVLLLSQIKRRQWLISKSLPCNEGTEDTCHSTFDEKICCTLDHNTRRSSYIILYCTLHCNTNRAWDPPSPVRYWLLANSETFFDVCDLLTVRKTVNHSIVRTTSSRSAVWTTPLVLLEQPGLVGSWPSRLIKTLPSLQLLRSRSRSALSRLAPHLSIDRTLCMKKFSANLRKIKVFDSCRRDLSIGNQEPLARPALPFISWASVKPRCTHTARPYLPGFVLLV